jgi:hypothetical protein
LRAIFTGLRAIAQRLQIALGFSVLSTVFECPIPAVILPISCRIPQRLPVPVDCLPISCRNSQSLPIPAGACRSLPVPAGYITKSPQITY